MPAVLLDRVEKLISETAKCRAWAQNLIAARAVAHFRRRNQGAVSYCVDASELIEYVWPRSDIPLTVAGALDVLLSDPYFQPLYMLPPHALELRAKLNAWQSELSRYKLRRNVLESLSEALAKRMRDELHLEPQALAGSLAGFFKGELPQPPGPETIDAVQGLRQLMDEHIVIFSPQVAQLTEDYEPDMTFVKSCHEALGKERPEDRAQYQNVSDAQALDFLRWVNRRLPPNKALVLYTHARALLAIMENGAKHGGDWDPAELRGTENIPLVQSPEVVLVYKAWFGPDRDFHDRNRYLQFNLAAARADGWSALEKRLHELKEEMRQGTADARTMPTLLDIYENRVKLVRESERGCRQLCVGAELVRTPTDTVAAVLQQSGVDAKALYTQFTDILRDDLGELESRRQQWLISVFPRGVWERLEITEVEDAVRISFPPDPVHGMAPTDYYFRSAEMRQYLRRIQQAARGSDGSLPRGSASRQVGDPGTSAISPILQELESRLWEHPEYYLLLSFAFSISRREWLLAYGAAEQGLRYAHKERGEQFGDRRLQYELTLAHATALGRWAVERAKVAQNERWAEVIALCFDLAISGLGTCSKLGGDVGADVVAQAGADMTREPRCLRELSYIYEWAAIFELPIEAAKHIFERPQARRELFCRAVECADKGYRLAEPGSVLQFNCANNILCGWTELAQPGGERHVQRRSDLAALLEQSKVRGEVAIIDTLGWHYYEMSKGEPEPDKARYVKLARERYRELRRKSRGELDPIAGQHLAVVLGEDSASETAA
jgi:hypothetical protein